MAAPYKTALIGLGKMGMKNADNRQISAYYRYSTHMQALRDHPDFNCGAFYDQDYSIKDQNFVNLQEMAEKYQPEVLVLATPPQGRFETIKSFSGLKAIVMEKPIAMNIEQARDIVNYCADNNILLQVNYWRRFDKSVVKLKNMFAEAKDKPQVVFMTYGNGVRNNAVHLIDQIRYLFGSVEEARALSQPDKSENFPIIGDVNVDFQLTLASGSHVYAHALDFSQYREISLDIWGQKNRVEFLQGGLVMRTSTVQKHRALADDKEISSDASILTNTGAGEALYNLYDNLALSLKGEAALLSDGHSALENERVLDKILS